MEIRTFCPSCDKRYRLPASAAGKAFKCKQCGGKVQVPGKAAAPQAPVAPPPAAPASQPAPAFQGGFNPAGSRRKPQLPVMPLAIGFGAAAVLGIVVFVVMQLMSSSDPADSEPQQSAGLKLGQQPSSSNNTPGPGNPNPPRDQQDPQTHPNQPDPEGSTVLKEIVLDLPEGQAPAEPEPEDRRKENADRHERAAWSAFKNKFPTAPIKRSYVEKQQPLDPVSPWQVPLDQIEEQNIFSPRADLELNINDREIEDVTLPVVYSPFIAIGDNDSDKSKRVIVDLTRGNVSWQLKGEFDSEEPAQISPDGNTFMLTVAPDRDTRTPYFVSRKTGRRKIADENIKLEGSRGLWSGFVDNKRAIVMHHPSDNEDLTQVIAINPETVQTEWKVDIPGALSQRENIAVSPTGKYLAIPAEQDNVKQVLMLATDTGEIVGRLAVPGDQKYAPTRLAFSPNGARLAGAFIHHLGVWDLTSGKLEYFNKFEGPRWFQNAFSDRQSTLFMVDNDAIVGTTGRSSMRICDVTVGQMVIEPPAEFYIQTQALRGNYNRHLYGPLFLMFKQEGTFSNKSNKLSIGMLDMQRMAVAKQALQFGGHAMEAGLPALEETFFYNANNRTFPTDVDQPDAAWPLELSPTDPTPPPPDRLEEMRIELLTSGESLLPPISSPRTTGSEITRGGRQLKLASGEVWLVNHVGGKLPEKLDLPDHLVVRSLSPDGRFGYFTCGSHRVVKVDLETLKIEGSWRVRVEDDSLNKGIINRRYALQHVADGGDNRIWVFDGERACLIDTDANKMLIGGYRVYRDDWELTHDRRYMLLKGTYSGIDYNIVVIDNQLGQGIGKLDHGGGKVINFKLSPEGTRVAAITEDNLVRNLVIIDVVNNKVLSKSEIPLGDDVQWVDQERVFIDKQWLALADNGRFLWHYDLGKTNNYDRLDIRNGIIAKQVKAPEPLNKRTSHISKQFPFPGAVAQQTINSTPIAQKGKMLAVESGTRVRIETSGVRRHEELRANLEAQCKSAGLVIDDSASFTIRTTQSIETKTQFWRVIGEPKFEITEYTETTVCEWIAPDGKVIWSSKKKILIGMQALTVRFERREDESSQSVLQHMVDEKFKTMSCMEFDAPMRLPWYAERQILGATRWDEESETMQNVAKP